MLYLMASETEIPVFDTESIIKRLTDANMPEAQARVVAEQQALIYKLLHGKNPEDAEKPPEAGA